MWRGESFATAPDFLAEPFLYGALLAMKRIVEFFSEELETMVAASLFIGFDPLCVVGYLSYDRGAERFVASTAGTLPAGPGRASKLMATFWVIWRCAGLCF